jgi:hypothetical protein
MTPETATIVLPVEALIDLARGLGRAEALTHVALRGGGAAILDDVQAELEKLAGVLASAVTPAPPERSAPTTSAPTITTGLHRRQP